MSQAPQEPWPWMNAPGDEEIDHLSWKEGIEILDRLVSLQAQQGASLVWPCERCGRTPPPEGCPACGDEEER